MCGSEGEGERERERERAVKWRLIGGLSQCRCAVRKTGGRRGASGAGPCRSRAAWAGRRVRETSAEAQNVNIQTNRRQPLGAVRLPN